MFFPIIGNILEQNSQKYFQIIHAEHTCQASGPNLPTVEQLELLCALIEVVAQGDAVAPTLDLPALCPELQVNGVARLEHLSQCGYMDTLCHSLIGMPSQTVQ